MRQTCTYLFLGLLRPRANGNFLHHNPHINKTSVEEISLEILAHILDPYDVARLDIFGDVALDGAALGDGVVVGLEVHVRFVQLDYAAGGEMAVSVSARREEDDPGERTDS